MILHLTTEENEDLKNALSRDNTQLCKEANQSLGVDHVKELDSIVGRNIKLIDRLDFIRNEVSPAL